MSEESTSQLAFALLRTMVELGKSAVAGEEIAKPFLDADAIRVVDGVAQFHKDRFLAILAEQMMRTDA